MVLGRRIADAGHRPVGEVVDERLVSLAVHGHCSTRTIETAACRTVGRRRRPVVGPDPVGPGRGRRGSARPAGRWRRRPPACRCGCGRRPSSVSPSGQGIPAWQDTRRSRRGRGRIPCGSRLGSLTADPVTGWLVEPDGQDVSLAAGLVDGVHWMTVPVQSVVGGSAG